VGIAAQFAIVAAIAAVLGPVACAMHLGAVVLSMSYMCAEDYLLHYGGLRGPWPHKCDPETRAVLFCDVTEGTRCELGGPWAHELGRFQRGHMSDTTNTHQTHI
jgi:hypothetical protein